VLVGRFDRLRYAGDVGDGRGGRNGHDVGVAHAAGAHLVAQAVPVERLAAIHLQVTLAAFARQYLDGIDRQDTLAPQRAFVGGVAATFLGQFAGRLDGEVADGFHGTVGKLDGLRRGIRDVLDVQRILEAHDAHAYRAVLDVGVTRLRYAVVVDVDHVIEHAHGGLDGLLQLDQVEATFAGYVLCHVHRAQVTHGNFILAGVQGDLGAQVRAVDHANVLLRRTQVARILEGHPRVAGFEQHRQHLAPQVGGRDALEQFQAAVAGFRFVLEIFFLEGAAVQVVQVWHVVRREQCPFAFLDHALHEQVRDPVGGVHVVGAAAVVTGVLAQLEEFLDVHVPGFQVRTDGALALAALVDGDGGVVDHFQERHDALRFAVGALDVGTECAHRRPVVAEAAGKLGQHGVVLDGAVNAVQVVRHGGQVARRQLRAQGAGVEQRRRRGHVVEARQQVVELDGALFAVLLTH